MAVSELKNGERIQVMIGSLRVDSTIQLIEVTKPGQSDDISLKIRKALVGTQIPTVLSWNQLAQAIGGQLASRIMEKGARAAYVEDIATSILLLSVEDPDLMNVATQLSDRKKNELYFFEPGIFRIVE